MLKLILDESERFPITLQDPETKDLFLVTWDHEGYLRMISLKPGGHIYSQKFKDLLRTAQFYRHKRKG